MEFNVDLITAVIGIAMMTLLLYFGVYYQIFKQKLKQFAVFVNTAVDSFEDDTLTKEEIQRMVVQIKALLEFEGVV